MRDILTDEERRGTENVAVDFMGYLVDVALGAHRSSDGSEKDPSAAGEICFYT